MNPRKWLFGLLCGGAFAALGATAVLAADTSAVSPAEPVVAAAPGGDEAPPAAYAARGSDTCLKCHDKGRDIEILRTAHAVKGDSRTPLADANHGCETCHGASPEHVNSHPAKGELRAPPAVLFSGPRISSAEDRTKACLGCHQDGQRINWKISQHAGDDVTCTNCHSLHTTNDPVLTKDTQPQVCFTCHTKQRADSYKFSHHPIREGKVVCADCHSAHGSAGPSSLKEVRVNDTCYNCHADKRGPNLWEHQPVREDCDLCHTPHGSTEIRLLKQNILVLCQNCHKTQSNSAGHGSPLLSKNNLTRVNIGTGLGPALQLNPRGCMNCHSQVHGSNASDGAYFTR